ncbi:MAG: hypothetical protein JOZ69_06955, partial [Myxococcales bacterium]|nr:hypothetical protein [Myxococcales bacterium]
VAVAELALGLVLALDRRIPDATADLRAGRWNKEDYARADGLKGKTLGIAGLGRVGSELAKRARAFEMRVVAWSVPFHPDRAEALGVAPCGSPGELADLADVVSVHLPLLPATRGIFGAPFFERLRPRAIFVNTSRGGLVDEAALARAMRERGLRVGLDVFEQEPAAAVASFRPAIVDAGLLVATPHIGASTEQAQDAIAAEAVRLCGEYMRTGSVAGAVNIEEHAPAECRLVVRHYDKVGVLAAILGVLRAHGANVEEMSNRVFRGAKTAVATMRLSRMPEPAVFAEIAGLEGAVIAVESKPTHPTHPTHPTEPV